MYLFFNKSPLFKKLPVLLQHSLLSLQSLEMDRSSTSINYIHRKWNVWVCSNNFKSYVFADQGLVWLCSLVGDTLSLYLKKQLKKRHILWLLHLNSATLKDTFCIKWICVSFWIWIPVRPHSHQSSSHTLATLQPLRPSPAVAAGSCLTRSYTCLHCMNHGKRCHVWKKEITNNPQVK